MASLPYGAPTFANAEDRLGKHDVAVSPKLSGLIIIPTGALHFCFATFEEIAHTIESRAIERDARHAATEFDQGQGVDLGVHLWLLAFGSGDDGPTGAQTTSEGHEFAHARQGRCLLARTH